MKNIIFLFTTIFTINTQLNAMHDQEMYSVFGSCSEYSQIRGDAALNCLLSRINWEDERSFLAHAHALLDISGLSKDGIFDQNEAMSRLLHSRTLAVNDPDMTDPLRSTLLHKVTRIGNIGWCTLLIKNNAVITSEDFLGRTPLHYAVLCDNSALLEVFAEYLTDPWYWRAIDIQDRCQRTALHYAYEKRSPEMITILINHGARDDITDWQGNIPSACTPQSQPEDPLAGCIRMLQATHL